MEPFSVKVTNPETNQEHELKIIEFVPSKGRGKDNPKLQPEGLANMSITQLVDIFGEKRFFKVVVLPRLKQMFANFTAEAVTKDDGVSAETDENVIRKDYSEYLQTLSARGETIQGLTTRYNEIVEEELPQALDANNFELAKSLNEELKELKQDIAKKKVKREKAPEAAAPAAVAA